MSGIPAWKKIRLVVDSADKCRVPFDPSDCAHYGPVSHGEEFSPAEGGDIWSVTENLYRFPSGKWIRTEERLFNLGPFDPIETLYRLDDSEAVEWFIDAGLPLADELKPVVKAMTFDPDAPVTASRPHWDKELGELSFRGEVVRRVRPIATKLIPILDDFQQFKWPRRIDSPFLPAEADKLRDAIRQLNENLTGIVFKADGRGEGVVWNPPEPNSPNSDGDGYSEPEADDPF